MLLLTLFLACGSDGASDDTADTSVPGDTAGGADDTAGGADDTSADDTGPPPQVCEPGAPLSGTVSLAGADARLEGPEANARAGDRVSSADLDGDGLEEILVAAPSMSGGAGGIFAARRPSGTLDLSEAWASAVGDAPNHGLGGALTGADMDGDGIDALAALASGAGDRGEGIVYLLDASGGGALSLDGAIAQIVGPDIDGTAELLVAVDLDGDGADALGVGDSRWEIDGLEGDALHLILEPPSGSVEARNVAGATWTSGIPGLEIDAVASAGDTDGDGAEELLIGVEDWADPISGAGAAWLLQDPPAGEIGPEHAASTLLGGGDASGFGGALAGVGDVNGDGYGDVGVGSSAAGCYVFYGPLAAEDSAREAAINITAGSSGAARHVGSAVAGADLDGDGFADVSCGAFNGDGDHAGETYLYYAPTDGVVDTEAADAVLAGEGSLHLAGYAAVAAPDVSGDGCPDLILGAYGFDGNRGAAYLLRGVTP